MRLYSFEKLEVWQKTRSLIKDVYSLTSVFPKEERFNLTSQIQRSAVSIASNLAEGSGSVSGKEQARLTEIAYSSLMELLNQLIIASDLNYLEEGKLNKFRPLIIEIGNKLNVLRVSQLKRDNR